MAAGVSYSRFLKMLGPVGFVALISYVGPQKIAESVMSADASLLLVALFLTVLTIPLKGVRWNRLLASHDVNISFLFSLKVYAGSFAWGVLTPGQLGEFSKVPILARHGFSSATLLVCSFIDRILDVMLLVLFSAAGAVIFSSSVGGKGAFFWFFSIAFLFLVTSFACCKKWNMLGRAEKYINGMRFRLNDLFIALLITSSAWLIQFFSVYLCSKSIGLSLDPLFFFAVYFMTLVVSLVPVSISGLGTRDACYYYFLNTIGVLPEQAIALSSLVFSYKILTAVLVYALSNIIKSDP